MTTFHAGERVRVNNDVALCFPGDPVGTVTDPTNGLTYLTVDVVLDRDGEPAWIFAPEELEHLEDEQGTTTGVVDS